MSKLMLKIAQTTIEYLQAQVAVLKEEVDRLKLDLGTVLHATILNIIKTIANTIILFFIVIIL